MKKSFLTKESFKNGLYISLVLLIIIAFSVVFKKFIYFLGRETVSWILVVLTYIAFLKVIRDEKGKWSLGVVVRAIATATFFIVIASLLISFVRNSDCTFNIFNRYCI
jgi:hypothetical protein